MANNVINVVSQDGQVIRTTVLSNDRGPKGDQGDKGDAATVTVGNTYTRPAGTDAAVMNSGTSSDAVLDFYIPKGEKGDKGADGAVHYTAGIGITISDNNVIDATGLTHVEWGGLTGNIDNQTDLVSELNDISVGANNYTDSKLNEYTKTTDLAPVATSGAYSDITGTPTIGSATLTIKSNNQTLGTFGANATADATIDVAAPVITMTNVDPGEGAPLAANHFIFYYEG